MFDAILRLIQMHNFIGISILVLETDISGLVMLEPISGMLTQVCKNWTAYTALWSYDNRHRVTQIPICMTSI